MANFNTEELLNIAHLSALKLDRQEIEPFVNQIKAILAYVDQLEEIPATMNVDLLNHDVTRNVNILRNDVAEKKDCAIILACAPEVDENFFVVPKILDEK